jgi:putative ABC transport system permease protein
MKLRETTRISLSALLANRSRTALTMLGLIIGVAAVIMLVSIGNGVRKFVMNEFESLGSNLIIIQPGKSDRRSHFGPPIALSNNRMTLEDIRAIERRAININAVSGVVIGNAVISHLDAAHNAMVFGANEQFLKIITLEIKYGGYFSREEDDFGRRVAVIGKKVADSLFGDDYAVGRVIGVNEHRYRVIGILGATGHKVGLDVDNLILVPTRAALRLFNTDRLFGIRATARTRSSVDDAVAEISDILKERNNGEDDFTVITQGALMASIENILSMLTYVLGGIAAISMLVGGIGIMNIMFVTVTERIAEIGLRRAVGATKRDIVGQFLLEAVMLSVLGGCVGVALASGVGWGVSSFFKRFDLTPPWWIIAPAFGTSLLIGVVFGVLPAIRAARIEPLEALRHE